MSRTMTRDLTEGKPLKLILSFAAPLLFGMLFQQLYSFVDTAIVGRYLEHSRIYVFGRGRSEKMYISSADFMTRNTERRVEAAVPILDKDIQARLHDYLDLCLRDNVKARRMSSDGRYRRIKENGELISAQDELMRLTPGSKEVIQISGTVQSAHKGVVFDTRFEKPKKKSKKKKPAGGGSEKKA